MIAGSIIAKIAVSERVGVLVHEQLVEVVVVELCAAAAGAVGAHASVEALLVGLGEVQQVERLAEAPRRVGALGLGVELAQQLVGLGAVRVAPQDRRRCAFTALSRYCAGSLA